MYKKAKEINSKYGTNFNKIIGYCNGSKYIQYLLTYKKSSQYNNDTLLKVNKITKIERFYNLKTKKRRNFN